MSDLGDADDLYADFASPEKQPGSLQVALMGAARSSRLTMAANMKQSLTAITNALPCRRRRMGQQLLPLPPPPASRR